MSIRKTLNICNCINIIFSIINAEYSNLNTIKSIEYRVCSMLLNALEIFAEIFAINPKHIQNNSH